MKKQPLIEEAKQPDAEDSDDPNLVVPGFKVTDKEQDKPYNPTT